MAHIVDRVLQVNRYLKAYVKYFDLEQFIQFDSKVINVDVIEKSSVKWNVEVMSDEKTTVRTNRGDRHESLVFPAGARIRCRRGFERTVYDSKHSRH